MSEADLLQPDHTIKDRWRVVSDKIIDKMNFKLGILKFFRFKVEQNRRRRLWSNLRSSRLANQRECGAKARINASSQASTQNGGDCAEAFARQRGQRSRVSLSWRRYYRALQLCGDDTSG